MATCSELLLLLLVFLSLWMLNVNEEWLIVLKRVSIHMSYKWVSGVRQWLAGYWMAVCEFVYFMSLLFLLVLHYTIHPPFCLFHINDLLLPLLLDSEWVCGQKRWWLWIKNSYGEKTLFNLFLLSLACLSKLVPGSGLIDKASAKFYFFNI